MITVGIEYNVCFCTQFGKQFVHFVFLGAHVSAVSLPLSPAGTFGCRPICYVWVIIGFTLCTVFCILCWQINLIWFELTIAVLQNVKFVVWRRLLAQQITIEWKYSRTVAFAVVQAEHAVAVVCRIFVAWLQRITNLHDLVTSVRINTSFDVTELMQQRQAVKVFPAVKGKGLVTVRRKPQTCSCSGNVRQKQGPVFSLGHSPCTHAQTLDPVAMQLHAALVCSIMVSSPVTRVIKSTHIPTPDGWKAELACGWLTHTEQFTHRVVTRLP